MTHRRSYRVGASSLSVQFGDLLSSQAEVLVSSDDYMLSMGGGVSRAISTRAGSALVLDATKSVPNRLGDVVVTTAGALPARYVFHVVTIGPRPDQDSSPADMVGVISSATERCLTLLDPLGVRSVAFPALGTGAAFVSMELSASAMADAIFRSLGGSSSALEIELWLKPRDWIQDTDYIVFFEELAKRVPAMAQHEVTGQPAPAATPARSSEMAWSTTANRVLELEQQRARIEDELAQAQVKRRTTDIDTLTSHLQQNAVERAEAYGANRRERSPVSIFVSYAHKDEKYRGMLLEAMAGLRTEGLVSSWHDKCIDAGDDWQKAIGTALDDAEIIVLVVSSAFLNSSFSTGVELRRALKLHAEKRLIIVPVIARPSDWKPLLGEFQVLPPNGKPISKYSNLDDANLEVAMGLRKLITKLRGTPGDGGAEAQI